jgi:hypothetical protein
MEHELQTLLAKQAIAEVIQQYSRGFDRFDRDLVRAVWHDDGVADMGDHFSGTAADFVDWCWPQHEATVGLAHQMLGTTISVAGDRASRETYVFVKARWQKDDERFLDLEEFGRYLDSWSFRSGRWAIDRRRFVLEMSEQREAVGEVSASAVKRWPGDPSFAMDPHLDRT